MKDWLGIGVIALIGAAIMAALTSSSRIGFGTSFLYVLVGLITITISMIGSIMLADRFARRRGGGDGYVAAGWLLGLFVITPIALKFAYMLLETVVK